MELVPSSEAAGSKEVVDAIESFLRHNGFDLAGPATIRLAHIRDDQWAVKPRMVLEADLK
ncbi:hypothetical protein RRF57_001942 [Xylaria bambusicola]|uniref:Uncharacterized protein n=1 Tax=Xylaria bambusicola TaxID=326684 RepID=A0AAN7Z207_9PEZI